MLANYGRGRKNRHSISKEQFALTGVKAVIEEEKWYLEVLFPGKLLEGNSMILKALKGRLFYRNFYKISESEELRPFWMLFFQ